MKVEFNATIVVLDCISFRLFALFCYFTKTHKYDTFLYFFLIVAVITWQFVHTNIGKFLIFYYVQPLSLSDLKYLQ